eukprot:COSAG05_NODE_5300_length_1211_cov_23.031475_3_plen_38_part_01
MNGLARLLYFGGVQYVDPKGRPIQWVLPHSLTPPFPLP